MGEEDVKSRIKSEVAGLLATGQPVPSRELGNKYGVNPSVVTAIATNFKRQQPKAQVEQKLADLSKELTQENVTPPGSHELPPGSHELPTIPLPCGHRGIVDATGTVAICPVCGRKFEKKGSQDVKNFGKQVAAAVGGQSPSSVGGQGVFYQFTPEQMDVIKRNMKKQDADYVEGWQKVPGIMQSLGQTSAPNAVQIPESPSGIDLNELAAMGKLMRAERAKAMAQEWYFKTMFSGTEGKESSSATKKVEELEHKIQGLEQEKNMRTLVDPLRQELQDIKNELKNKKPDDTTGFQKGIETYRMVKDISKEVAAESEGSGAGKAAQTVELVGKIVDQGVGIIQRAAEGKASLDGLGPMVKREVGQAMGVPLQQQQPQVQQPQPTQFFIPCPRCQESIPIPNDPNVDTVTCSRCKGTFRAEGGKVIEVPVAEDDNVKLPMDSTGAFPVPPVTMGGKTFN